MAGSELPQLDLAGGGGLPGVADSAAPNGAGLAELAQGATAFAGRMEQLATAAHVDDAQRQAIADVQSGRVRTKTPDTSPFGHAYRATAKAAMGVRLETAIADKMGEAYVANPDNPDKLDAAFSGIRAGFGTTGFPDLDLQVDNTFARHRVTMIQQARVAQRGVQLEQAKADASEVFGTLQARLVQQASGLTLDNVGDFQLTETLADTTRRMAAFGPKTAFKVNGIEFPADDSRAGVLGADQLATSIMGAKSVARSQQIEQAVARAPSSEDRQRLVESIRDRWQKGDAALAGVNAQDSDTLFRRLDALVDQKRTDERAVRMELSEQARNGIEALKFGGNVNPDNVIDLARRTGDVGLEAQARYMAQTGGKGGQGGFAAVTPFIVQSLENNPTIKRDINGYDVRFGINAKAHPGVDLKSLTYEGAMAIYRRDYWDKLGLDSVPPQFAAVVMDAAVVHGSETARGWMLASHGDIADFQNRRHDAMLALVKANPAKYGPVLKGWENRLKQVTSVAAIIGGGGGGDAAYAALYGGAGQVPLINQEGFASDPIRFMMGTSTRLPMATVPQLNMAAGFAVDQGAAAGFGQALRQRRALRDAAVQKWQAPPRMLSNGEREYFVAQLAQNAAAAPQLAQNALNALGPQGAQQFMQEVAGGNGAEQAAVALHIASLHTMNPRGLFAQTAARGLALRAQGNKAPEFKDKTGDTWDQAQMRLAPALSAVPGVVGAMRGTAELAHLADFTNGWEGKPRYYLNSALGGHQRGGVDFGGVTEVNGRLVVLPTWLRTDAAQKIMPTVAESWTHAGPTAPVYSNGQAVPAGRLARMQLQLTGEGNYRLLDPGSGLPVRTRRGDEFRWEADRAKSYLYRAHPKAVLLD